MARMEGLEMTMADRNRLGAVSGIKRGGLLETVALGGTRPRGVSETAALTAAEGVPSWR
jgi:hypothetical protein